VSSDYTERLYFIALNVKAEDKIVRKRLSPEFFEAKNAQRACERLRQKQPKAYVVERVRFL
jgi:hypothetical protein